MCCFCHFSLGDVGAIGAFAKNYVAQKGKEDLGQQRLDLADSRIEPSLNQLGQKAPSPLSLKASRPAAYKQSQSPGEAADDSASVVSELINRLKQNLSEQQGSWWRMSMMHAAKRPLMASFETSSRELVLSTCEIQEELAPVCHVFAFDLYKIAGAMVITCHPRTVQCGVYLFFIFTIILYKLCMLPITILLSFTGTKRKLSF